MSGGISVIIPTYNRSALLRRTLESLAAQRCDAADFEVIVADDGSSDDTAAMLESFGGRLRLRYWFQEDQGYRVAAARNAGAALGTAPVLAFLDSGTLAGPDFVAGHLAAHETARGACAVLGYCYGYNPVDDMSWLAGALDELPASEVVRRYRDEPAFCDLRHEVFEKAGYDLTRLSAPWGLFWTMNCSVTATAFRRAGGFDETFRSWGGEDYEFGYRLSRHEVTFLLSHDAWSIELPNHRRLQANRQSSKRNSLRILAKHCEPMIELYCAAELRDERFLIEDDGGALRAWTRAAAGLSGAADISRAVGAIPDDASVAVFGCGGDIPSSLPAGSVLLDFDSELLAGAVADGRHSGYQLIGVRTPLRAGSVDVVMVTGRLSGVWDRWGKRIVTEAHRVGRQVVLAPGLPQG
jgi:glycosyltransferase involved in cell wall biosynthesis